jgi:hypothetical protein
MLATAKGTKQQVPPTQGPYMHAQLTHWLVKQSW